MLHENLRREEDLTEFALHGLRVLKYTLIDLYLAKLLLQLLIPRFYLSDGLTKVLIDLNELLIILISVCPSLIDSIQHGLMHVFILLYLLLHE